MSGKVPSVVALGTMSMLGVPLVTVTVNLVSGKRPVPRNANPKYPTWNSVGPAVIAYGLDMSGCNETGFVQAKVPPEVRSTTVNEDPRLSGASPVTHATSVPSRR